MVLLFFVYLIVLLAMIPPMISAAPSLTLENPNSSSNWKSCVVLEMPFLHCSSYSSNPTECAVYIVRQNEKALFDEADYLITDFGNFAAVYPRYWAE